MFHKLLFLGPGGRTVYQGTVDGAVKYFDKTGNSVPANVNPADFYMDVIGGVTHKGEETFDPAVLFRAWEDHMGHVSSEETTTAAVANGTAEQPDEQLEVVHESSVDGGKNVIFNQTRHLLTNIPP